MVYSNPDQEAERTPVVLVAEDEVLLRVTLAESLRKAGYSVLETATGDEALLLLASGVPCDLVVSDVQMPGQADGQEVLRRSRLDHPDRPVILVSGHLPRADAASADGFFNKPYDVLEVVAAVGRFIEERE